MSTSLKPHYADPKGAVVYDFAGFIIIATGTTPPIDGKAGYSEGALFINRTGAPGSQLYINQGSTTSCDFNSMGGVSITEIVTANRMILAADSGKTFFLAAVGGFAMVLPAPAVGLRYKFIVSTSPTTAYTIATNAGANIIIGGINELATDSPNDGPYSAVGDMISFVASVAVTGDWCELVSDGTKWFLTGQTNADGGVIIGST